MLNVAMFTFCVLYSAIDLLTLTVNCVKPGSPQYTQRATLWGVPRVIHVGIVLFNAAHWACRISNLHVFCEPGFSSAQVSICE